MGKKNPATFVNHVWYIHNNSINLSYLWQVVLVPTNSSFYNLFLNNLWDVLLHNPSRKFVQSNRGGWCVYNISVRSCCQPATPSSPCHEGVHDGGRRHAMMRQPCCTASRIRVGIRRASKGKSERKAYSGNKYERLHPVPAFCLFDPHKTRS